MADIDISIENTYLHLTFNILQNNQFRCSIQNVFKVYMNELSFVEFKKYNSNNNKQHSFS